MTEPASPGVAGDDVFGGPSGNSEWDAFTDSLILDTARPSREHFVTAIVVSHDGEVWLPAVLTALARQTRPVNSVVGVDNASQDSSPAVLRESLGADAVVQREVNDGFGSAASAGFASVAARQPALPDDVVRWVWLLHDDSAPDLTCLERLLQAADEHPSADVLGPKILGWHDRRLLLEVGVSIDGDGRRVTGLEQREHDQGQHDGVRDVLA
ncbi:MAG: glycosyltransferase, partial [Actinomycetota bacterium]|nr:glycosyltransferase [Actinomycetota bacterium]